MSEVQRENTDVWKLKAKALELILESLTKIREWFSDYQTELYSIITLPRDIKEYWFKIDAPNEKWILIISRKNWEKLLFRFDFFWNKPSVFLESRDLEVFRIKILDTAYDISPWRKKVKPSEELKSEDFEFTDLIEGLLPKVIEILKEINNPEKKIENAKASVEDLVKRILDM